MAVRVSYRADQADRAYGRVSTQIFPNLNAAVNWSRTVAAADLVSFIDTSTGQSIPVGLSLAAGPNVPGAVFTDVPNEWGQRWRLVRERAGTQRVNVHVWGDSATANGVGSSAHLTTSIPGLIQYFLQYTYGDGGSGFLSHEYAAQTGTWSYNFYGGMGGTSVRATAAATMQWTNIIGTTIRIYCRNTGVTGSFRYRIDGGSFSTVTPPNPFTGEFGLIETTGLSDVPHTLDLEWVSGTVFIHGIAAYRSTGVTLSRFGQTGRAASDYSQQLVDRIPSVGTTNGSNIITTPVPGSFRSLHIGRYAYGTGIPTDATITGAPTVTGAALSTNATATGTITLDVQAGQPSLVDSPVLTSDASTAFGITLGLGRADLVIIGLGGVDVLSSTGMMTGRTFREGISRILRGYTDSNVDNYSPDVVFILEHIGNGTDFRDRYGEIVSEARAMAESFGGAVVDIWGLGHRSFKFWDDQGFLFDAVHPNDLGSIVYARPVIDLLVS